MGACLKSYSNVKVKSDVKFGKKSEMETNHITHKDTNMFISDVQDLEFPDMPEWEGERYKGEGIKRMKGYVCTLNIDDLNKIRETFWVTKIALKDKWKTIRQACVFDHIKAEDYLSKNGMRTLKGCINMIYDNEKNVYKIPNYCINDPHFEKEILPPSIDDSNLNTPLTIKIIDNYGKHFTFKVTQNTKGSEIKDKYSQLADINPNEYKIRLLFGGNFIEDDQALYQHKVMNDYTVQIAAIKL